MIDLHIETDKLFTNITGWLVDNIPPDFTGLAHVYTPHTTAAVALLEDEILHLVDVRFFLDAQVPISKAPEGGHRNSKYIHDLISLREGTPPDERVNGHSHLRGLFFSSSELIPVANGEPMLGEWKSLFFVELDPIRPRSIVLNLIKTLP